MQQQHELVDVWSPEQERRLDLMRARGPAVLLERTASVADPAGALALLLFFHVPEAEA